jgi:hypothetical protein
MVTIDKPEKIRQQLNVLLAPNLSPSGVPIFVDWEKKAFCGIIKFVDCRLQNIKKKVLKYLNSWIFTSNS